jgi:hypothetical protein
MIACFRPSIAPNLVRSIALGYITVSTLHFSLDSMDKLTLLRSALLSRERSISSVRLVRTSIELLITAPLQRSTNVHKRITLNRERALCVSGIEDRRGLDAAERAVEGLRVSLAGLDSKRAGAGDEEEDSSELHLGGLCLVGLIGFGKK